VTINLEQVLENDQDLFPNLDKLSPEQQQRLLDLLKTQEEINKKNKLSEYFPDEGIYARRLYPKQLKFFAAGKDYMMRAMIAANQSGKTLACAYEMALHLTGLYPDWWEGRRFTKPVNAWAIGVSSSRVKSTIQKYLLGSEFDIGTGMIPADCIARPPTSSASGVAGLKSEIFVKHYTNGVYDGISTLELKSYADEREKFQGSRLDVIWMDEEDKKGPGIFNECITRFATTNGIMLCSFTPLYSLSEVVLSFIPDIKFPPGGCGETGEGKYVANATWEDIPHLNEQAKKILLATYPEEERNARCSGIPGLGAGLIYPVTQNTYAYTPNKDINFALAKLPRTYMVDIAYSSGVTAALWAAFDESNDTWWVYDEYYCEGGSINDHAIAITSKSKYLRGGMDPSSQRALTPGDKKSILDAYREKGVDVDACKNEVWGGITKVRDRLVTGRLRISVFCEKLLWELKQYRRDDKGEIVKKNDHACDCLRYIINSGEEFLSYKSDEDEIVDSPWNRQPRYRDKYTGY
jgi:phage terminase large subunit-like protein